MRCKFHVLQLCCSSACSLQAEHTGCMCRVRKSHSDTALSGLERDSADKPSVLEAFKADGQPGASSKQAMHPRAGPAEQPEAAAAAQVTSEGFGSSCFLNSIHALISLLCSCAVVYKEQCNVCSDVASDTLAR